MRLTSVVQPPVANYLHGGELSHFTPKLDISVDLGQAMAQC